MNIQHLPKSLDELVGLIPIKKSLNLIDFSELVKPIMFIGEKGCGKSNLAHIIASMFGAEIENIRDVNCGNYRKIDDMRKEIDLLQKSSMFGSKKVLILDEVHQLLPVSQSPWLKELDIENLKSNILIIACTTEIAKLLPTFLRRFDQYKVKPLTDIQAKTFIDNVCTNNDVQIGKIGKTLILQKCANNPSLILSGLRKIIGIEDQETIEALLEVNSITEDEDLFQFFKLLIASDNWDTIKRKLSILLKEKTPADIQNGVLNLISGRLMSNYFNNEKEGLKLIKLYESLKDIGYLEKSGLIVGIYKSIQ